MILKLPNYIGISPKWYVIFYIVNSVLSNLRISVFTRKLMKNVYYEQIFVKAPCDMKFNVGPAMYSVHLYFFFKLIFIVVDCYLIF